MKRIVLPAVLLGIVAAACLTGLADPPAPAAPPTDAAARLVRLTIDYGDGVQKVFTSLEHRAEMTVLDALLDASRHPRGITVEHTGRGQTAFVRRIDDLANQGGGAGKRNWLFLVNGKKGTRGSGVTTLAPGDQVAWEFSARHLDD